jgi:GNAT superfamily N-acetyltransferase
MPITYTSESFIAVQPELEGLIPGHWEEIARDKDIIKLDPDWPAYHQSERAGQLHMTVCRADGQMVGYIIGFVRPHLHYRKSLSFICDIFYLLPAFRSGRVGIELFKANERFLRQRGVQKVFLGCKIAKDLTPVFTRLGYRKIEYVFAKVIQ